MNKSYTDPIISKLIRSFLRDDQKSPTDKVDWFIGYDDEDKKIFLQAHDIEQSILYNFPLLPVEATFIGYCLIQQAISTYGYDNILNYLKSLAERRNETLKWMDEVRFKKVEHGTNQQPQT